MPPTPVADVRLWHVSVQTELESTALSLQELWRRLYPTAVVEVLPDGEGFRATMELPPNEEITFALSPTTKVRMIRR